MKTRDYSGGKAAVVRKFSEIVSYFSFLNILPVGSVLSRLRASHKHSNKSRTTEVTKISTNTTHSSVRSRKATGTGDKGTGCLKLLSCGGIGEQFWANLITERQSKTDDWLTNRGT